VEGRRSSKGFGSNYREVSPGGGWPPCPDEIREKDLFPHGFLPLPHVKQLAGGMVFPTLQITEINKQEARSLERFDADFDLPDHLMAEFLPPYS
jgi:cytochrome c peroxidase